MIEVDVTDGIGVVRLAHGKVNALDLELCRAIEATLRDLDSGEVRAVVLTGSGRAFSAGVDLERIVKGGADYVTDYLPALVGAFQAVFDVGKPAVAAVNGHAIAGGCVLAAACDHRVMAAGTGTIGVPELYVGVPFPAVALEIMEYALGPVAARRAILGGRNLAAAEALAFGLVDEVAEPEDLLERALVVADRLATAIPADVFRHTKRQLHGDASQRLDADAMTSRLWQKAAADGRIRAFMDRTVGSRRRP
ncbi:enoyl-CoA hydratase/isomerase family protein [Actinomadura rudentiformis]|uniref:Enoyl-CoA hydratase/isomerase family protein n=1 Tax=Actinomadura rudentiformis TaxID=359158 RepID=A0A6H9YQI8_9ACTN|nr:enoyl-CoA hydratase/isomerase family protein [Actinomadura rudentiformis]KAB2350174.1 enoyl-CoA hydratase/isomerase family protein [Actinomadura rudentiformis]